jgi:hypothetical protein
MATANPDESGIAKIDQHRDDLTDLANSDLPCAYLAEALLEVSES